MKREVTALSYVVTPDCSEEEFGVFLMYDVHLKQPLVERLWFVRKVDYDGHFGHAVFVDIDVEDDNNNVWDRVEYHIKNAIQDALDFQKAEQEEVDA